jgi:hypothetical protein
LGLWTSKKLGQRERERERERERGRERERARQGDTGPYRYGGLVWFALIDGKKTYN